MFFAPADPECEETIQAIREVVGPLGPTPWERFFRATRWQNSLPEVEEDVVAEAANFEDWWGQHEAAVSSKHARVDSGETCSGPPSAAGDSEHEHDDWDEATTLEVKLADFACDLSPGSGIRETAEEGSKVDQEADVNLMLVGKNGAREECAADVAVTVCAVPEIVTDERVSMASAVGSSNEPAPALGADDDTLERVGVSVAGPVALTIDWQFPEPNSARPLEKPVAWRSVSRDSPVRRPGRVVTLPPKAAGTRGRGFPAASPPPPHGQVRVNLSRLVFPRQSASPAEVWGAVRTIVPSVPVPAVASRGSLGPVRRRSAQL
mmetsp:Transcript_10053/g.22161  ORF Transcript_10053/g.22161 Transcript_10053/m.22161 type:complete len:321 (-) Transcript_10053:45-1007(-)